MFKKYLALYGAVLAGGAVCWLWAIKYIWPGWSRLWLFELWAGRAVLLGVALVALAAWLRMRAQPEPRTAALWVLSIALLIFAWYTVDLTPPSLPLQTVGNYAFTQDGTTKNAPIWAKALAGLAHKPGVNALEVGTYEGRSAIWFLENILTGPSSSITCIDIFDGPYERTFDRNVSGFGARVKKIRAPSQHALRSLKLYSYDFAYIDGSHVAKDVLVDALLTWDLIKPGGFIIFDDYQWEGLSDQLRGEAYRPKIAIEAFLRVMEPYIEVVHSGYQVIVRKRTEFNRQSPQAQ